MIIDDIINVAADCSAEAIKTGRNQGCELKMSNLRHAFLSPAGFRIPVGTDFVDAYFTATEVAGNLLSLANAKSITFTPSEDTFITDAEGKKTLDVKGLPEFVFNFEESHAFYKELSKLTSYGQYDLMIADEDNTIAMADYGADGYGGFEAGHVTVSMVTPKVPGTAESINVTIQLLDRNQYDKDKVAIVIGNHGIKFRNHTGVSPLVISYPSIPSPGTAVQIKVTLADGKTPAAGLVTGDFTNLLNGAAEVITWTEVGVTGVYDGVLTTTTIATDVISVATNGIIALASKLYKGDAVAIAVV